MANITLAIPEKLHAKMKKHTEIRWSEVVRKSIAEKVEELELMKNLTKKDINSLSKKINSGVAKKLGLK
jgi:hypothetical protein